MMIWVDVCFFEPKIVADLWNLFVDGNIYDNWDEKYVVNARS